ncbi:putative LRR receptor-like serine/threonine-protein kinase At3g47570 [Tasmannia lanceolata]|uniref:putative LRR receptor-like serine/threonine-protein kinase At3g47570 n=1 Tax=Tasmannia lanceolata TaxID=3420 RepID=UPI00406410AE
MDHNLFQGTIPSSLANLKGIRELDLSHNNLSRKIPEYLKTFHFLEYLNLSFNDLEGEVPKEGIFRNPSAISVYGNNKLCGGILELQLPACPAQVYQKQRKTHSLRVIILTVSVVLFLTILSFFFATLYWKSKPRKNPLVVSPLEDRCLKFSYAELLRATNGFSLENLIGAGSYGSVYKGLLDHNETVVAVKGLSLQHHGATKSFKAECEALRNIRHQNLIKILTSCSSIDYQGNDFKALVFEYMPNGSLEKWLHQSGDGQHPLMNLTLIQRLNVAIDVASALDYLHHHGQTPLVHGDLKPSNVLLDDDMNAHVGDFGLARFIFEDTANHSNNQSSSLTIKGSIGYVAPGKAPTNNLFTDGLTLNQFAKMALPDRVIEITNPQLISEEVQVVNNNTTENHTIMKNRMHDCVVSMFRIGVSCCGESPRDRMQMGDVVEELHALNKWYQSRRSYSMPMSSELLESIRDDFRQIKVLVSKMMEEHQRFAEGLNKISSENKKMRKEYEKLKLEKADVRVEKSVRIDGDGDTLVKQHAKSFDQSIVSMRLHEESYFLPDLITMDFEGGVQMVVTAIFEEHESLSVVVLFIKFVSNKIWDTGEIEYFLT